MQSWLASVRQLSFNSLKGPAKFAFAVLALVALHASAAFAQPSEAAG